MTTNHTHLGTEAEEAVGDPELPGLMLLLALMALFTVLVILVT